MVFCLDEIGNVAADILASYPDNRIFILKGEMGAGKTTLVKALCRHLGVVDETASPTFAIINEYASPNGRICHLDLYRLKSVAEALDIGILDIIDSGDYCFIEWPELIEGFLPEGVVTLSLADKGGLDREIQYQGKA